MFSELEESNQELQAQLLTTGLQEGMQLLNSGSKSLAAELEDMSADQARAEVGCSILGRTPSSGIVTFSLSGIVASSMAKSSSRRWEI